MLQLPPVPALPPVWAPRCPRCPLHPHTWAPRGPPPRERPGPRPCRSCPLSRVPLARDSPRAVPPGLAALGSPRRGKAGAFLDACPPRPAQRRLPAARLPVGQSGAEGGWGERGPRCPRGGHAAPPGDTSGASPRAARPRQAPPLPPRPRPLRRAAGGTNGAAAAAAVLLPRRPRAARQGPRPLAAAAARGPRRRVRAHWLSRRPPVAVVTGARAGTGAPPPPPRPVPGTAACPGALPEPRCPGERHTSLRRDLPHRPGPCTGPAGGACPSLSRPPCPAPGTGRAGSAMTLAPCILLGHPTPTHTAPGVSPRPLTWQRP